MPRPGLEYTGSQGKEEEGEYGVGDDDSHMGILLSADQGAGGAGSLGVSAVFGHNNIFCHVIAAEAEIALFFY